MEYNWPLYQNSTTTGSSSSSNVGRVRGHNGHFSNPPAAAWETTPPPSDYNINHPSFGYPDPNLTVLKLGKRHYDPPVTPPPGPSRINGNPRCQVDGCDSVLQTAKEYHRRHKVCEVHAKAPIVLLLGIEQRFCQQCSRFHALTEFDDSKRSCRRRLAGHNQRRRKTSSQDHHHSQVGRHPQLLNNNSSTESALSLLSSPPTNNNYYPISDDLPARCSAALRDLIAENRASVLAHRHGLGPRGHVTLDLMQDPASPFGLLSHKDPKQGNAQDCSELWRLPLGY